MGLHDWLEIIGKGLVFCSFWFVVPELFGEERLRDYYVAPAMRGLTRFLVVGCWATVFLSLVSLEFGLLSPLEMKLRESVPWLTMLVVTLEIVLVYAVAIVLAFVAGGLTQAVLEALVLKRALARLADDASLRRRLMEIGACLFGLGSYLDIYAWVLKKISHPG